ncbi:MAG: hypothetical protein V4643_07180 [Bacteroidota bacterium]
MGKTDVPILLEQIRKVKKGSYTFKTKEMNNTSAYLNNEWVEVGMFLVQGTVPKRHYLIIDKPLTNNMFSQETFFVVYMITHSHEYNNILIKKEWVQDFDWHEDSHVTTDTFIIREADIIMNEQYGAFDLKSFKNYLEANS